MDQWKITKCPRCGAGRGGPAGVHSHADAVWCLRCGWGMNLNPSHRN